LVITSPTEKKTVDATSSRIPRSGEEAGSPTGAADAAFFRGAGLEFMEAQK
jgi:hypothetical protein